MTTLPPSDLDTPEGWARFCGMAGMKTQGLAYKYARFDGISIAEAVNRAIAQVIADMYQHDVPMEAIASYYDSYMDYRPQLMEGVAQSLEDLNGNRDD